MTEQDTPGAHRVRLAAFFLALVVHSLVVDLPRGIWHELRCEAIGREWEWVAEAETIDGTEFEFDRCSACGAYRPHPGGV